VSACEPTSQASGWRTQNCFMSDIVAEAALTALAAPTPSGVFIDSGGRQQQHHDAQPERGTQKEEHDPALCPSSLFAALEDTLAEAIEGEVGSVRSILRMFEPSFRRLFLKFERFSSLKNRAAVSRPRPHARHPCLRGARAALRIGLILCRPCVARASARPSFGKGPFTIRGDFDARRSVFVRRPPAGASHRLPLAFI
jgi:hypothetical protein